MNFTAISHGTAAFVRVMTTSRAESKQAAVNFHAWRPNCWFNFIRNYALQYLMPVVHIFNSQVLLYIGQGKFGIKNLLR